MMSTAYSGRTANRATVIRARALGMSCSAASAPQDMANAAPTIPSPKRSVATSTGGAQAPSRSANAGTPATTTRMTANTLLMNDSRGADVTGWWSDDDAIHPDPPHIAPRLGVGRRSGRAGMRARRWGHEHEAGYVDPTFALSAGSYSPPGHCGQRLRPLLPFRRRRDLHMAIV